MQERAYEIIWIIAVNKPYLEGSPGNNTASIRL